MNKIIKKIIRLSLFFPLSLILASEVNDRKKLSIQKMEKRKHFPDKNQTKKTLRGIPLFPGANQVDLLRSLLDAPPENLRILRKTIERVEGMSPEQKKDIKHRLRNLRNLQPEGRTKELRALRHRQDVLGKYWKSLDPEMRKEEMRNFYQLSFADRTKYFNQVNVLK
jgi:hypothetical protein